MTSRSSATLQSWDLNVNKGLLHLSMGLFLSCGWVTPSSSLSPYCFRFFLINQWSIKYHQRRPLNMTQTSPENPHPFMVIVCHRQGTRTTTQLVSERSTEMPRSRSPPRLREAVKMGPWKLNLELPSHKDLIVFLCLKCSKNILGFL